MISLFKNRKFQLYSNIITSVLFFALTIYFLINNRLVTFTVVSFLLFTFFIIQLIRILLKKKNLFILKKRKRFIK
jgi:hypothetical protein